MYVFKSSFLRAKNSRDGYKDVNLTSILMRDVVENYTDGYIVLTHTQLTGTFYLTIDNLRSTNIPMYIDRTFNQWLTINHDIDFNVPKVKPTYKQATVLYSDAIKADFKIDRVGRYLPVKAVTSDLDKVDLLLRKNIPNRNELYTKVLATVNGFTHRVFSHEDGIAVANGGETFNNTGINTVGILSFSKACDISQHVITESMLTPATSTTPLYKELIINLGMPLVNKTIMLSIGGHLMINNGVADIVNAETGIILVKLNKVDLIKMLMNSVGKINLDSLGVFPATRGVTYNKVRVNDLQSDLCVKKYMTLPQSFVIVADTQCIQIDYSDVETTGLPSVYESKNEPIYPLMTSQGLIPEYWKIRGEDHWSIRLYDDITKRKMYLTNISYNNEVVNSMSPTYKWFYDDPKFMKITVTHKVV